MNQTELCEFALRKLKMRFATKINSEEYYLSYSGGKDSHLLYFFIKEYLKDDKIQIVGVNTRMEHEEIRQRMINNCDVVLVPKLKPFEIKERYGIPCFSKWQDEMISRYQNGSRSENTVNAITGENRTVFKISKKAKKLVLNNELHKVSNKCCKITKKDTLREYEKVSKRKPIVGVRGGESAIRKQQYRTCLNAKGMFSPLYDFTDDMIDAIYREMKIEVPEVYKYLERTGCFGCPYGFRSGNTEKELSLLTEAQRKFAYELFRESYEVLGIKKENIEGSEK